MSNPEEKKSAAAVLAEVERQLAQRMAAIWIENACLRTDDTTARQEIKQLGEVLARLQDPAERACIIAAEGDGFIPLSRKERQDGLLTVKYAEAGRAGSESARYHFHIWRRSPEAQAALKEAGLADETPEVLVQADQVEHPVTHRLIVHDKDAEPQGGRF